MKFSLNTVKKAAQQFGQEEDGAQVIEYALIIALVSIALAVALSALDVPIDQLQQRISDCLSATGCTAAPTTP